MMTMMSIVLVTSMLLMQLVTSSKVDVMGAVDPSSAYAIKDLLQAYKLVDKDVDVSTLTTSLSDSQTIQALAQQRVDFGVITTDMPSNMAASHSSIYMVPLVLTSLVPIYRLDAMGTTSVSLIIPRDVLARIYLGEITNFRHPDLLSANPSAVLPDQNITLVLQDDIQLTYHLKRALRQFYPAFSLSDRVDDWPWDKYAKYRRFPATEGTTALITSVITFDGSLGVYYHANAVNMAVDIARMTNAAGVVVTASPSSMALAASEMGTTTLPTRTSVANLFDATNSAAFPMSLFSYLILDVENTRGTCRTKQALVELLLYFYQSSVVTALLKDREYAQVPQIIQERLEVIPLLKEKMMCRGNRAYSAAATNQRLIGVAHQWLFNSRLLAALYLNVDKQSSFTPQLVSSNDLVVRQMIESEIDVGLVNPANVDPTLWKEFTNMGDFTVIPLFTTSIVWFLNPQIAYDLNLNQLMPANTHFRVDPELIILIYTACVSGYEDEKVLELNPWLRPIMANRSIKFEQLNSCSGNVQNGPAILQWAGDALAGQMVNFTAEQFARIGYCLSPENTGLLKFGAALAACASSEEDHVYYVDNELIVPDAVLGRMAAVGASVGDNDPNKLFPSYAQYWEGKPYWSQPDIAGTLACAKDTYDPLTMTFNFALSRSTDCYPMSRQTVALVRKRYYSDAVVTNSSSCVRGLDALQMVRWMIETRDLNALTESSGLGRLADVSPSIKQDYINALNMVLCDEEPLLITLPIIWSVSPALTGFGCAAAGIGFFVTILAIAFVCIYHRNPILRAASPLLMLISLLGILGMFVSIILFVMPPTDATCAGVAWLFSLGMMVTFSPLFAKTWRVYKIFGGRRLSVVKISNRKLLTLCSILLVAELIILTVWQTLSPLRPTLLSVTEGSPARVHEYMQCRSNDEIGDTMFVVDAIALGLLFVFGALMAVSTRKVASTFNEASQIGLTIYNCIFTIGIIAIIITVTEPKGDVHIGLCLVVAIWISFFTVLMLVLPKVLQIFGKQAAGDNNSIVAASQDSNSAFSFLSLDMFTSLPMIGSYAAALRLHLDAVERKQASLKRGTQLGIATRTSVGSTGQPNHSLNTHTDMPQPSPSGSLLTQDSNNSGRRSTSINTTGPLKKTVLNLSSRAQ